jgi:hypothetical protein
LDYENEFMARLMEILLPRSIALVLSMLLLWKFWSNNTLRRMVTFFIIAIFSSALLEPLLVIKEMDMRLYGVSIFYANFWGALLFLVGSIYEISLILILVTFLWFICHYKKNEVAKTRPANEVINFIISIFTITLVVNVLYTIGFGSMELTEYQFSVSVRQLVFIQILSSYVLLLSMYYAIGLIIPSAEKSRSTRKTLWLLLLPIFNIYWMVKVLKDWTRSIEGTYEEVVSLDSSLTARLIVTLMYLMLIFIGLLIASVVLSIKTRSDLESLSLGIIGMIFLIGCFYTYRWFELLLGVKRIEARLITTK